MRARPWIGLLLAVGCAPVDGPAQSPPATSPSPSPARPPPAGACVAGGVVLAGEAENARDLGGIPLDDGTVTACGQLFRGAHLAQLGPQGCASLAALGVRTIIDLRTDAERAGAPDADCGLPVVAAPLPIPYELSPANYLASLRAADSMRVVAGVLAAGQPTYFHCVYGRDRTGVVAAALLSLLGASREEIVRDYRRTEKAGLFVRPDSLEATLDELERIGGAAAYWEDLGVATSTLAQWRARWRSAP